MIAVKTPQGMGAPDWHFSLLVEANATHDYPD